MRVLHIINTLEAGGAQTVLLQLLQASDKSDQHLVISLRNGNSLDAALMAAGAQVRRAGTNPLDLLRVAKEYQPDVIQSWLYHSDLLASFVAVVLRCPLVWGVHHTTLGVGSVKPTTMAVVRVLSLLSRVLPARIICCSESALRSHIALGYPADKCVLIENGIDVAGQVFDPAARASVCIEFGIRQNAAIIGMFARYNPQKDHHGFLKAARILVEALAGVGRSAAFLLAGPGVDETNRELLSWINEQGVQAQVRLLGSRADVPRLISAVDVLTLSSAYGEALPMVLCEGMAQGALCVATDVGDTSKLLGEAGWVVPPSDPPALAKGWMQALQTTPAQRKTLGQQARDQVENHYSSAAMSQKYAEVYKSVCAKHTA